MKAKELRDFLNNVPDNAEILIECDFGHNIERSWLASVSRSEIDGEDYEAMIFEYDDWRESYDEDYIKDYPADGKITAVLIQS